MKYINKRFLALSLTLIIALLFTNVGVSSPIEQNNRIPDVLKQWEEALNKKDEQLYLDVFDDEMREISYNAIHNTNEDDIKNVRFFAVTKVKIKNIKHLKPDDIKEYIDLSKYANAKIDIVYFCFDAYLEKDDETSFNKFGENYNVCILTQQNGTWKISQMSGIPVKAM